MTGHRLEHDGAVPHRLGHRPGLIERGGKRHDAPAADPPISGLEPGDADKGGGLPDRATRIGTGGGKAKVGRNGGRRSARRPAGCQRGVLARLPPRVHDVAVDAGLVAAPHGELVHVELAHHDGAVIKELPRHGRFILGPEPVQDARRRLTRHALGAEEILDAKRDAAHVRRVSGLQAGIRRPGLFAGEIGGGMHDRVQHVRALDGRQAGLGQVGGGDLARAELVTRLGDGQGVQIAHVLTPPPWARRKSLRVHPARSTGSCPASRHR